MIRRRLNIAWFVVLLAAGFATTSLFAAEEAGQGLLFRPIESCILLDTEGGVRLAAEPRALDLEGVTVSTTVEGEAEEPARCRPDALGSARAALLRVVVDFATAPGSLKLWAGKVDDAPKVGVMAVAPPQVGQGLVLVDLCPANLARDAGQFCSKDLWTRLDGAEADLRVELVGVFEAPSSGVDLAEPPQLEAVTSALTAPFWQENVNGIHFNDGKVGIRASLPESLFQVGSWEMNNSRYLFGGDTLSMQGITGKDHLPYLELRDENLLRAFYLGWGSKLNKYITWKLENGFDLAIEGGKVGYGTSAPARDFHIYGTFKMQDPVSGREILDTWPRSPTGYAGGVAHNRSVLVLQTPYQRAQASNDEYWIFASPEVWGGEAAYSYAFDSKNLRFGVANDGWRRAEIEIFNDNTAKGKILFRTGVWQDPDNLPASSVGLRMVINESGNVGIGTPSPASRLVVTHDAAQSGSAAATATFDALTSDATTTALTLRAPGAGGVPRELLTVAGDGRTRVGGELEVDSNLRLSGNLIPSGDLCIGACQ